MKKIVLFFAMMLAMSAFANGIFQKTDPKAMKQIQYRKVMALEEIKILEKYVQCLNNADDTKKMRICTSEKESAVNLLWKDSKEIKQEVGQKTKS